MMPTKNSLQRYYWLHPAVITLAGISLTMLILLVTSGWDAMVFAQVGTRFGQGQPNGTEGYDGQFVYFIARDLNPGTVAPYLDVPAYRYQRILLPFMAHILSFGSLALLPWVLAILGVITQVAGTWAVAELLVARGVNRWYALVYGLWVGFALASRLDLPEPLAYGLVAGALLAHEKGHVQFSWLLYGMALFAKETAIVFIVAQGLADLWQRRWGDGFGLGMVAGIPWILFQGWLWLTFGNLGISSGGAMATSFEIIPLMGLWRIGMVSNKLLLIWLVIFGPSVVFPTLWGLWSSLRRGFARDVNAITLGLFFNALLILMLPFSTFREPNGLLRYSCGLVFSVLLFAAQYRQIRVLNYSLLWLVLNVFLVKA